MAALAIAPLAGLTVAATQKIPPNLLNFNEHYTLSRIPVVNDPQALADLRTTDNVIDLKRATAWSPGSSFVQALRRQAGAVRVTNGTANLLSVEAGAVFLAPVQVGGQQFEVVIDSGSSDPWLVTPQFTCVSQYDGSEQDQEDCLFGPGYIPDDSSSYIPIPGQNFNISYADGEFLTGDMGYESFTMGGITVPHQEFATVDYAAWKGDNVSSGLVGFAPRILTSAYSGTDPHEDTPNGNINYNPFFVNMYTNQGVPPVFTLAINRDYDNGGVLALGGIPNIPYSPGFTSTPIIPYKLDTISGSYVYEFYTVEVDGFAFSTNPNVQFTLNASSTNPRKTRLAAPQTQAIVDSGTSIIYADNDTIAAPVAAAFRPPGFWNDEYGVWRVDCHAIPPVFGVAISGKIFYVNSVDMVLLSGTDDDGNDECISGVQPSGTELTILGDVWMKNVLCVFDLGAQYMRFAARQFYGLTAQSKAANT